MSLAERLQSPRETGLVEAWPLFAVPPVVVFDLLVQPSSRIIRVYRGTAKA